MVTLPDKFATLHVPTATGVAGYIFTLEEVGLLADALRVTSRAKQEQALYTKLAEIYVELARPGQHVMSREELRKLAIAFNEMLLNEGEPGNGDA